MMVAFHIVIKNISAVWSSDSHLTVCHVNLQWQKWWFYFKVLSTKILTDLIEVTISWL